MAAMLRVRDLATYFFTPAGVVRAVEGVSLALAPGEILGLVGESGSGKSVTAFSLLNLIEPPGRVVRGEVWLNGRNLLRLPRRELRRVWGKEIALTLQDAQSALNPVLTIGTQMVETLLSHARLSPREAKERVLEALSRVGLPQPTEIVRRYPFQLSGGQRQRVLLAMAMQLKPKVLVADEPTTALDVTVQAQILAELRRLREAYGTAVLLITHDLSVVAAVADRVAVMYAGSLVEYAPVEEIFAAPQHPYTRALLGSLPRFGNGAELRPVGGQPPSLADLPGGCPFHPRCPEVRKRCREEKPVLREIGSGRAVACHLVGGEAGGSEFARSGRALQVLWCWQASCAGGGRDFSLHRSGGNLRLGRGKWLR